MRELITRLGLAAACAFGIAAGSGGQARAAPFTYNFAVSVTAGPLAGQSYAGSLSYDSTNTGNALGLLTDLSFTFGGIAYTAATANTGTLFTNADGTLAALIFGNNCTAGSCVAVSNTDQWFFSASVGASTRFVYSQVGSSGTFGAAANLSQVTAVPEPTTAALLAAGLLGLATVRRRRA